MSHRFAGEDEETACPNGSSLRQGGGAMAIITTTIRDVLWLELPESYGKDHTQYREAVYNYLRDRYDRSA